MQKVLTAAQMREVDRLTTERYGIPSIVLMENAAHAVARVITEKLGGSIRGHDVVVLCGPGNNGGDGAALARILWSQWCDVDVFVFGKVSETRCDARTNFDILRNLSKREPPFWPALFLHEDAAVNVLLKDQINVASVIVDCLFGTGLTRPLDQTFAELFEYVNEVADKKSGRFLRVAVDLPSGLCADSVYDFEPAFDADVTVTFTAPKIATVLPPNNRKSGELHVEDIGSPAEMVFDSDSQLAVTTPADAHGWLRATGFSIDSYKNKRGHAMMIAGSDSYSGAAVLAGNAAMRSGVGLVTVAAPKECKAEIASRLLPDVILTAIDTDSDSPELLAKADAIAVGCGLSATDPAIERLVRTIVNTREVPVVIDAGALWFYSPFEANKPNDSEHPLILTPHEGEFMRLLGTDDKDAIKDRVAAVREFATKHNVILVLKGERVLIGAPDGKVVVNPTGNSGLGKAGNGDTLTGILAGFVAQGSKMNIDIFETVVAAVYIAGMAGDVAEKKYGKRVMTASDVRECLTEVFASFEESR